MSFELQFTNLAEEDLSELQTDQGLEKKLKAVRKTLAYLQSNPRHPSLNTHKYSSLKGASGEEVFEAYAENKTPAAYSVFWHYGPGKNVIAIIAITSHP